MQRSIASILSIFLPPLLPFGSADMEISQTIQTAALTAMGLLYLGSGNRHLSEVMLREIAHVPGPELEFADDRESYSLAAGIALGMITLGRGGDLPGMGDLRLVERLAVLILGGPKSQMLTGAAPNCPSHLILEPEVVNTHVTSPAATVALGLMYLKTNESSVASRLDAPSTLYELDHIRPDFFILRMASRGLIMWSDVQPTQEWINNHIPEIVQRHAFQSSDRMEGQCDPNIDYQTLSQAMVCISAGCCLAIGLRYAGTLDKQAHSVLMKNVRFLLTKMTSPASAEEVGKSCLEMCINVAVLSVAMVMSGSGDLEVLRIIRRLHARVTPPEVTYGSHMASHMALGFLFLGGCRYSLSRSDKAIACLYSAVFPLFPSSTTDTRYHLQALRHLYVLAAEPRVLVTRDVETGQATSVEVCVRGEREIRGRTPCIVPEWSSINEIEICSCDFWPIKLSLSGEENRQVLAKSGTAFVRRKTGEKGGGGGGEGEFASGALLPQHFYTTCCVKGKLELFGEDGEEDNPLLRCLYSPLLAPQDSQDTNWQRFMTAALLECVSEEKLSVFPSLLHLEKVSHKVLSSSSSSTTELWQLKLGCALAEMTGSRQDHCPQSFHSDLATLLMMRVKQSLYKFGEEMGEEREEEVLRAYFMCGRGGGGEVVLREKEAEWLAATIVVYGIPPRHSLGLTTETTYPELLTKMQALNAPPSAVVRLLPMMKSKLPEPLSLLFP
jgi:anaphase-promoting complex subunit 1